MTRGLFLIAGLCGMGCVGHGPEPGVGALSLALQQRAASGELYRLSGATLSITGAEEHTVEPEAGEVTLELELATGSYALSLEPGYVLQREQSGSWVDVEATLVSDNPQPFAIEDAAVTRLALRFALDGGPDVDLAIGTLAVTLEVGPAAQGEGCAPRLVINEVDYDQEGADVADFAELYNAGNCALDTVGVMLSLINGGVAEAPSYAEVDLTLAGPSLEAGQFVVVGRPELAASLPAGTGLIGITSFAIQNGSPDGLRLARGATVLDSLTYGGLISGVTETASTPADRGAGSLGRCPDGLDSGDGSVDFAFLATPTPGAPNACPCGRARCGSRCGVRLGRACVRAR
jgi:hypothetical protein